LDWKAEFLTNFRLTVGGKLMYGLQNQTSKKKFWKKIVENF
jgi:hypothetical protein